MVAHPSVSFFEDFDELPVFFDELRLRGKKKDEICVVHRDNCRKSVFQKFRIHRLIFDEHIPCRCPKVVDGVRRAIPFQKRFVHVSYTSCVLKIHAVCIFSTRRVYEMKLPSSCFQGTWRCGCRSSGKQKKPGLYLYVKSRQKILTRNSFLLFFSYLCRR